MINQKKLKYYRKRLELKQIEISYGICSVSYYSKIENGVVEPSEELLTLLCNRLNISILDIKDNDSLITTLCSKINEFNKYIRNRNPGMIEQIYQEVTTIAANSNNPEIYLVLELFHLRMSLIKNNSKNASLHYQKVQSLKNHLGDRTSSFFYRTCGLFHYFYGNLETSLLYYKNAEKCISNEKVEEIYYQLALVYSRLNKLYFSSYYLNKALDIFHSKMEYDYCINCNLLLGVNYRKMREYDNAIDCYKKVIEQAYISKDFSLLAKVYHNIGLVYSKKEQYEIAIDYFLRSIEEEENKHALPSTYYLISKEYIMLGKLQDAKEWVLKGIRLAEKYDIKEYLIKLKSLECIVDTTKRYNLTTYINQVAIPFYEQRHDCESVSDLVLLLANYLEKERKYKDAYLLLKKQYKGEI